MPRGTKKAPDFNAKIGKINEQIATLSSKISDLKAERTNLLAQQEEHELKELNAVLKATGKSPAEIRAMLDNSN